ncbi:MAG: L-arabinonate dehydratase [Actinomycetota bacterium]|jgi:dihydroxy-acid dehydratase|nr:L-arabinonate dehydratase [Actinomycetota bacterium]
MTGQNENGNLRSARWWAPDDLRSFGHRSRLRQMGYTPEDFLGKPVIAIVDTGSDINPCHQHFRQRVEEVKRGVWQAGGFPLQMPALSLSEPIQKPSSMLYRNLLSMEVEELLRSYPIDGAVLMGGCDKTTPALVMGATSAQIPSVFLPAGPMLRGNAQGKTLASGTSAWRMWADRRAGLIGRAEVDEIEQGIARSAGHCMTMGTASTMTAATEALGLTLPGASSLPAADSRHAQMAALAGRQAVEVVRLGLTPARILTEEAFDNAVTVVAALGGSTNSVIHLIAMARRAGIQLGLERFDELSRRVPTLANLAPSGEYLMEDFFYAGGLRALMARIADLLHLDALTVNGQTIGQQIAGAEVYNDDVIRTLDNPLWPEGGLAVLHGNLAPDGAVIKQTAAAAELLVHTGPAVVFENYDDMAARIDDENLEVGPDSVLVLRQAGPIGGPGMPEWGQLPLPAKLLREGIRDLVRISDARMSGTSYGTCVLHVAPESAAGGPLALVRTGDLITLDVPARRLHLEVSDEELERRRAAWTPPPAHYERGWGKLYSDSTGQANEGCDLTFLQAGPPTPEPAIH